MWESIHADALATCVDDGCEVQRVLGPVRTHGVGNPGAAVRRADTIERGWSKDMPAYKSLRRQGIQPRGIDGCDRLSATATNEFEFKYGDQAHGLPAERVKEAIAEARDIVEGR